MREHLITDPAAGWRLTGLLDFEPAMIGDPAYDLVAVGLFTTRADPHLLGQLLGAYGRAFEPRLADGVHAAARVQQSSLDTCGS